MTDRELMQQALDVLTDCGQLHPDNYKTFKDDVIAALRERLAREEKHTTRVITDANGRKHITNEPLLRGST